MGTAWPRHFPHHLGFFPIADESPMAGDVRDAIPTVARTAPTRSLGPPRAPHLPRACSANEQGHSSAITRAPAHYHGENSCRPAQLVLGDLPAMRQIGDDGPLGPRTAACRIKRAARHRNCGPPRLLGRSRHPSEDPRLDESCAEPLAENGFDLIVSYQINKARQVGYLSENV
jgi:hypothetical protein